MKEAHSARSGVMLDVFDQGVLLLGESGSGKSDVALALVDRGHFLVADDLVEFYLRDKTLFGCCREGFAGFIEINGLGVINLRQLYGDQAVREYARLDLVLSFETQPADEYDCLKPVQFEWQALGQAVTAWRLHCQARPNMALIVETAVRLNHALRQGYDASSDLQLRLASLLNEETV